MIKPILFSTPMVQAIIDGHKTMTRRVIKPPAHMDGLFDMVFGGFFGLLSKEEKIGKLINKGRIVPKYSVGDVIWVRETWQYPYDVDGNDKIIDGTGRYIYLASPENWPHFTEWVNSDGTHSDRMPWKPSIFMPKEAARIFLKVTNVNAERLQDITEKQAQAEGISRLFSKLSPEEYAKLAVTVREFKSQDEQHYDNYLWHGNVGYSCTSKQSEAWTYQYSGYESAVGSFSSLWESINAKRGYGWAANPWVWVISFERCEKPEEFI